MDDLARELGMSKKTLYRHFGSKREILETLLKEKLASADADLGTVVAGRRLGFAERLRGMLECVRRHTSELSPTFLRDMGRDVPELFGVVQERRGELIRKHWGALVKEGMRQGLLRRDIPVEMLLGILVGAADAVITPAKLGQYNLSPQEAYATVVRVFLEGIVTRKGRESL